VGAINLKELDRKVVRAIEWGAAEYRFLEQLKEEIEQVEKEPDVEKEIKKLHKAAKTLNYLAKAEKRLSRILHLIGRSEDEWKQFLRKMKEHGMEEAFTSLKEVELFRTNEIRVARESLIQYSSMYEGKLREKLNQVTIEAELEKEIQSDDTISNNSKRQFMEHLQRMVDDITTTERWIKGLEVGLINARKKIETLSTTEKRTLEEEALGSLQRMTETDERSELIIDSVKLQHERRENYNFLMNHPTDLNTISNLRYGPVLNLIVYTLPLTVKRWDEFMVLIHDAEKGKIAHWTMIEGLKSFRSLLNEKSWSILVRGLCKILKTYDGVTINNLFTFTLPVIGPKVNEQNWDDCVNFICSFSKIISSSELKSFYYSLEGVLTYLLNDCDFNFTITSLNEVMAHPKTTVMK